MSKVGRTIAQKREKAETESERMQARKKLKLKKAVNVAAVVLLVVIVGLFVMMNWRTWFGGMLEQGSTAEETVYKPTVEITDEDGAGVTNRMKDFVGKVERDFTELGFKVERAVVPTGKSREIDVYLEGREEYVKLNLDRGTAVGAEDAVRMLKYLDEKGIKGVTYVDVRVEGKGYYK